MKTTKKILSLVLVLIMLFTAVPMTDLGIEASATSKTRDEALAWVRSQNGKSLDVDGYPASQPYQCVDFIAKYYEYLGVSRSSGNGCDYATNTLPSGWSRVKGGSPQPGDILVYTGNTYGHVAIYEASNAIWHQNWGYSYVIKTTNKSYNSLSTKLTYWGYIRPNFSGGGTPVDPNAITYHDHSFEDLSTKNARIKMWISNPSGKTIFSTGFYFGADPDNLSLYVVHTNIGWTDFCADYNIVDYCGELSPGTKYYYRFYVVEEENFNYSQSDLYSFTTYGTANVRYNYVETTAVSSLDANISAWAWNDVGYTISSYGFYLGESPTNMKKYQVYSNIAWTNFHTQVDVAKYTGALTPGKTYYYRFYAVIDTNYYSDVYSFTTNSTLPVFTVTFNANGGSCSTASKNVTYSSTYGTLPAPTLSGYSFNGWYTAASGGSKVTSSTVMKEIGNHTLYAHWTCNHSTTEVRNAKTATCTATGYTGDTYCKTCGTKTKTGTITAKTAHNSNTKIPAVAATCTKTGLTEGKKCSVCGTITVAQQTVAKKAHSYTASVTTQPTCTKEGVKTYKCSCGASYTESIAKKAHTIVTVPAVSATCTNTGLSEGKKCAVCGTVTVAQSTVNATGHKDNNFDGKCDNCGLSSATPDTPTTPDEPAKDCTCNCHGNFIQRLIFKIINFFQKLFGKNKICACGVKH